MAKMGRPRTELDWAHIARMCLIQCTQREIASVLETSEDTLNAACKREHGITFAEWSDKKRDGGRRSLRRKQYQVAMKGNVAMLIWLGKQMLGQKDRQELSGDPQAPVKSEVMFILPAIEEPKQ